MSSIWPRIGSDSLPTVVDATARLALTGVTDGYAVVQLDTNTIYTYDSGTDAWVLVGGSGFVDKTGDTMTGSLLFSNGEGIDSVASGTPALNIGTVNASTVNIGKVGGVVNILGTTVFSNVESLNVTDTTFVINSGGGAASAGGAGIEVEEDSVITGYIKVASDRNGWDILAPNQTGLLKTIHGGQNLSLDFSGLTSSAKTYTALNASGTVALTSTTLTAGSIAFANSSGVLTQDNSTLFWDSTNKYLGLGTATPAARLNLSGDLSANSWTTNGINLRINAATYTNTSSSGTLSSVQAANAIGRPTFASSSALTVTDSATLYIANSPAAGTNTTLTRPWTIYTASGKAYFSELNVGSFTQLSTLACFIAKTNTNTTAGAVYAQGNMVITSASNIQSAGLTGDMTCSGSANNTSTVGAVGADGIGRSTNTATVTSVIGIRGICTNTSTGTVTNFNSIRALPNINTGGGTVTNNYAVVVDDQTVGSTLNIGMYLNISNSTAGSGKYNIYANGSSPNYLSGNLSIGTATASAKLHVLSTTEQQRIAYDGSNYFSTTVSSAGLVQLDATGSSAGFQFLDRIIIPTATPSSGGTGTAGQLAWDGTYWYVCVATNTWGRVQLTLGY